MNKKGQSIFTVFFWVLVFIVIFFLALSGILSVALSQLSTSVGGTGIEGFLTNNLMLIILLVLVIAILAYIRFSGQG
jgi:hypothetical protein